MTGKRRKTAGVLVGVLFLVGLMIGVFPSTALAQQYTNPNFISFTLEGCRNNGTIILPNIYGDFICPDPAYTTGNLGKGWNELDLVPHRLTTAAGNQTNATTDYNVIIAADEKLTGKTGYDNLSVPVVNNLMSDDSCTVIAGPIQIASRVTGGVDEVAYRKLTIHQDKNTTCVFDYYIRLALGAHLYSGSSLQSYMFEKEDFSTGKKTISIPVNEIKPQSIAKDMAATQGRDWTWDITKSETPATLNFADTCNPSLSEPKSVSITVSWDKVSAAPGGPITVITHVYATNPAARVITVNVDDVIYEGAGPGGTASLDTVTSGPIDVPANTANYLVLTHTATLAPGYTLLNDIATATYTDKVTGIPVPGTATANASAQVQYTTELNASAIINDVEGITGSGLQYSADSFSPDIGDFDSPYAAGTITTGNVSWTSDNQTNDGSVTFSKKVYVDPGTITSGTLQDTATLTGVDGFTTATGPLTLSISADAKVILTINKTIPDILEESETATFTFQVKDQENNTVASPTISFAKTETSKNITVSGLAPGTYTVSEDPLTGWDPVSPQTVDILLPNCSNSVTFNNTSGVQNPATAQVRKITVPGGYEAGWTFTLSSSGPGGNCNVSKAVTTIGTSAIDFGVNLIDNCTYTITETAKDYWDTTKIDPPSSGGSSDTGARTCTFSVDLPGDAGKIFDCVFTNSRVGQDLTVTKTATGTYDRSYLWLIDKSVDKTTVNIAQGGTATFNYSVKVDQTGVTDTNWTLAGKITVNNPNAWAVAGVNLTDAVDNSGACTVTGGSGATIPGKSSVDFNYSCTYASQPSYSGINSGTATWDKVAAFTPNGTASGSQSFTLTQAAITNKTVYVTDTLGGALGTVTGTDASPWASQTFTYSKGFTGVGGKCTNYDNTATIIETSQSDSEKVTVCVGLDLTISKTAAGTFDRTYLWTLDKSVDKTTVNIAQGGTATFNYSVKVDQTGVTDANWALGGIITLSNPNEWEAITLTSLSDAVTNGGSCAPTSGPYVVPPSGSISISYTCSYASKPPSYSGTNTGTANWNSAIYFTPNGSASGSAGFALTQVGSTNKTVHATDTYGGALGTVTGTDGAPFASATFNYSRNASGVAGTCTNYDNTATITETSQNASKTVSVCVGLNPTITKTAAGTFNRTYLWDITKDVDKTLVTINNNTGTATFNYTVTASQTGISDSGWAANGTITVNNPNNWEAITVNVTDAVDNGGTCTVTGGTGVSIPASGSITFNYTCSYASAPSAYSGTNTATATWDAAAAFTPSGSASGSAVSTLGQVGSTNKSIHVTDTLGGALGTVTGNDTSPFASATFTYSKEFDNILGCNDYDNTATITETEDSASKTVQVCVKWSHVTLLKLTQGAQSGSAIWNFTLYEGTSQIASDATPPTQVDFGGMFLDPQKKYTLCEMGVPSGWTTMWKIDTNSDGTADTIINPYNPNYPFDAGNRCFDFGAGTSYPLYPDLNGKTLTFEVDNTYPGGEPRTPGYWKNWSSCTGGNQTVVAAKNGGPDEGWFTLDDLLNNPGFTIGFLTLGAGDCQEAVRLLDKSTINTGKKMSSDAAYNLATALFAAELNLAAGAETCSGVQDAVIAAQELLTTIGFDGTGDYLGTRVRGAKLDQRNQALSLAATLDNYNNGGLCP